MKNVAFTLLFLTFACYLYGQDNTDRQYDYNTGKKIVKKTETAYTLSPYAMFGDSTVTITTEHERKKDHTLKIPIENGLFEMDMRTGFVTIKDNQGAITYSKQLTNEEKARFIQIDPLAEMNYSISPYVYAANNPIRNIDPDGRLQVDSVGNIITEVDPNAKTQTMQVGDAYLDFIEVTIFSNKGKGLTAKMITGGRDKDGNVISLEDASANCVGFSVANGALWVDNDKTISTILDEYTNLGTGAKGMTEIGYLSNVIVGIDYTDGVAGSTKNFAHMSRVITDVATNSLAYPQKDSYHPRTTGQRVEDVLNFRGDATANNYSPSMLVYYQKNNQVVNRSGGNTTMRPGLSIFPSR